VQGAVHQRCKTMCTKPQTKPKIWQKYSTTKYITKSRHPA